MDMPASSEYVTVSSSTDPCCRSKNITTLNQYSWNYVPVMTKKPIMYLSFDVRSLGIVYMIY